MSADLVKDLVRHKWHANAAYLAAVYQSEAARQDEELRKLFHHILVANRFWLFLTLGREFDLETEGRCPDAIDPLLASYEKTAALEVDWLARCDDGELNRQVVTPFLQGHTFTVAEAAMQICLHSHGHRAQAANRLRSLGGTPPRTDYILWVMERPAPLWPSAINA